MLKITEHKKRRKKKGNSLEKFWRRKKKESRTRNPAEGWREERMEVGGRGVLVVFS